MASASPRSFKCDPYAGSLIEGPAKAPETFGLNLQVLCSPNRTLDGDEYIAFVKQYDSAREALKPVSGTGLGLFYEPQFLHVTVASPIVFTSGTSAYTDEGTRSRVEAEIAAALDKECTASRGFPEAPFELVYESIQSSSGAAFLRLKDPSGAIDRIRACVRKLESHAALRELGVLDGARGGFKMPSDGFVHATIWRPAAPVAVTAASGAVDHGSGGASASGKDPAGSSVGFAEKASASGKDPAGNSVGFAEKASASGKDPAGNSVGFAEKATGCLERAAAGWKPVAVTVRDIRLVRESRAYMHLGQYGEEGCSAKGAAVWQRVFGEMEADGGAAGGAGGEAGAAVGGADCASAVDDT